MGLGKDSTLRQQQTGIAPVQDILPIVPTSNALSSTTSDTGLPARLVIPSLYVDAPVTKVGLTSGGAMDVPKHPAEVAWYKLGARPGDTGSAVIAGHYGRWLNGEGSVFDDLNTLKPGDEVFIEDEQGIRVSFVVTGVRTFNPTDDATDVFVSSDGKAHLNLVTCEGVWNETSQAYSKRLVVFTDRQ